MIDMLSILLTLSLLIGVELALICTILVIDDLTFYIYKLEKMITLKRYE